MTLINLEPVDFDSAQNTKKSNKNLIDKKRDFRKTSILRDISKFLKFPKKNIQKSAKYLTLP
ncbi:MAG: hypothetical protein LBM96_11475 [Methanobrevibacter sp.]|nr:hypothetical protein [Candidatus Methanoflexus mossambicus]